MNKKKFILGILVVMAMAIYGVFCTQITPHIFADEITAEEIEIDINDAGTFTGQGYYEFGQTATLTAVMNPGYKFNAWVAVDDNGVETELSKNLEYTFVVDKNINIKPTVIRLEYDVDFAENLGLVGENELRDFTYEIVNKTQTSGKNYYNDQMEIQILLKSDKYIDDLNFDITIDDVNSAESATSMNLNIQETNEGTIGFRSAVITFNIKK